MMKCVKPTMTRGLMQKVDGIHPTGGLPYKRKPMKIKKFRCEWCDGSHDELMPEFPTDREKREFFKRNDCKPKDEKLYKVELWHSDFYGHTIIASELGERSGFRLAGPKLWAGQNPPPRLVVKFTIPAKDIYRAFPE